MCTASSSSSSTASRRAASSSSSSLRRPHVLVDGVGCGLVLLHTAPRGFCARATWPKTVTSTWPKVGGGRRSGRRRSRGTQRTGTQRTRTQGTQMTRGGGDEGAQTWTAKDAGGRRRRGMTKCDGDVQEEDDDAERGHRGLPEDDGQRTKKRLPKDDKEARRRGHRRRRKGSRRRSGRRSRDAAYDVHDAGQPRLRLKRPPAPVAQLCSRPSLQSRLSSAPDHTA